MAQPGVLRARQPRVAAGLELAVLGAAHAIDALVEVLGAVEAIEHDLRLGVGHLGERGLHVRLPHVHRDRLHLRPLRRGQPQGPEGFQALPLAVVGDEQHPRALEITHHGDVVVPALEGLLVHPDVAQLERPAALQAARDRPALDAPHGVPPQLQLAGDRSHGRFPQPVDRQPLEQQRELRARSRPRDRALHHAVGRALHAGHTRVESGLELARVEMPPLPLPMIVDRARGLAFGTRRRRALGAGQPNVHGAARDIQLDPLHRPRRLHPQDRRVQLPVPHRPTSSASSAAGTIAGGVSDGHVTHTRPGRATMAMVLLTALLLGGGPARAQEKPIPGSGALDAIGPGGKPLGACPLRHTEVAVEISGFVARVTVTQLFASRFTEPVEALYSFPLSDRAAVDAMSMRTGERTIHGEIKRREEARRIYEAARKAGQVAALLDQERPNIFTQTLANLIPGATVEIRIEYVEPLVFRDGTFEFSFPTVVGPRFIPGAPTGHAGTGWAPDTARVPDASRITPPVTPEGTRAGHDIAIAVDIDAGVPILDVVSPLHEIDVERPEANKARVHLRDQAEIPNRDFVLRYEVAGDEVRSGYLAHRDGEGDGYVTFVLLPPKRVTSETAAPKEMIFVIDRSGSQAGLPLEKAKETMRWILDHMNPNDTFQVVDFGNTANVLFPTPQPASPEMKRQARAHIDALEANGGTMMAEAVRTVCSLPAHANRLRVVTFMTDGYIGNDFEVIDLVRSLRGTSRWFSFGAGNGVNRFLLEGLARAGGGEVDYILLNDSGEAGAQRLYRRIAPPGPTPARPPIPRPVPGGG